MQSFFNIVKLFTKSNKMDIREILTISGKSGLFKLVSNSRNTFIVESLADGKRFPAFARDKVSSLDEISIFTDEDDMPLRDLFVKLYKYQNHAPVDAGIIGDNDKLKALFDSFIPNYDRDRLYVSHMKKIAGWYNELLSHDLISEEINEDASSEEEKNESAAITSKENKQTISDLKKTNVDKPMPKNASSKSQAKTITTKPKAK